MAFPSFSNGTVSVTFARGYETPSLVRRIPTQIVQRGGDRTAQVYTVTPRYRVWTLQFRNITSTEHADLIAFLEDASVNFAAFSFTFTDTDSATYTVRLGNTEIAPMRSAANTYTVTIELVEEP